jgi:hypothetical protein
MLDTYKWMTESTRPAPNATEEDKNLSTFAFKHPPKEGPQSAISACWNLKDVPYQGYPGRLPAASGDVPPTPPPPKLDYGNLCIETHPRLLDDHIVAPGVILIQEPELTFSKSNTHSTVPSQPPPSVTLREATLNAIRAELSECTLPSTAEERTTRLLCYDGCSQLEQDLLGIAVVEHNDGQWEGPNNCRLISLRDCLVSGPKTMRRMLATCFTNLDISRQRHMAQGILAHLPTETVDGLADASLVARCVKHILNEGELPAELLIVLLENSARIGNLDKILRSPTDIVFFQAKPDSDIASFSSTAFTYPGESPRRLALIQCNTSGTHFERIRLPTRYCAQEPYAK